MDLTEEAADLKNKELLELEELTQKLSRRDRIRGLEAIGNSMYGYVDNKKTYLMTLEEYYRYRELYTKYKNRKKSSDEMNPTMKSYKECDKFFRKSCED